MAEPNGQASHETSPDTSSSASSLDNTRRHEHYQALISGLTEVLRTGKYSDLTITCGDRQWEVHKAIMCSASKLVSNECDSNMRESQTNVIKHEEFDEDTVDSMISYVYTGKYTVDGEYDLRKEIFGGDRELGEMPKVPKSINDLLITHINVYAIGNYFDIPALKTAAAARFSAASGFGCNTDGFLDVVRAVWKYAPHPEDELREKFRMYAAYNRVKLRLHDDYVRELAEQDDTRGFAEEVLHQIEIERQRDASLATKTL
jgi:hypothetical protein